MGYYMSQQSSAFQIKSSNFTITIFALANLETVKQIV